MLVHGTGDTDVAYEQSMMTAERLRQVGNITAEHADRIHQDAAKFLVSQV
jgi:hypothetical protein